MPVNGCVRARVNECAHLYSNLVGRMGASAPFPQKGGGGKEVITSQ